MLKYFKLVAILLFVTPVYADGLIITPSQVGVAQVGQIPGTATNDNASAGKVGEYFSGSLASGSSITLTSLSSTTVVSISLTPGDYDVRCNIALSGGGSPSTVLSQAAFISATDNTLSTALGTFSYTFLGAAGTGVDIGSSTSNQLVGPVRISLNSTTTYYCVTRVNFTNNAPKAYGIIEARRIR